MTLLPPPMSDITEEFYNDIFIPKKVLNRKSPRSFTNSIFFRSYCVFGKQESGKTELIRSIVEKCIKFYGKENVNARLIEKGNLQEMFTGFEDKMVNFFYIDDLTLRPIPDEVLTEYFRSRHLMMEQTGRRTGYVLVFLGMHRFHGITEELRTNLDGIIIKSSAFNDYDRNWLKRKYGDTVLTYMDYIKKERIFHPELYNTGYYWDGVICGRLDVPLAKKNLFEVKTETEIHDDFLDSEGTWNADDVVKEILRRKK